MAIPDPIGALIAYLKADTDITTLAGTRVFAPEMHATEVKNQPRQALVLSQSGGGGLGPGRSSLIEVEVFRLDVRAYGATHLEAMTLSLAAHSRLKTMIRTVQSNTLLHNATISGGPLSLREPILDWPLVLRVYDIMVAELATA